MWGHTCVRSIFVSSKRGRMVQFSLDLADAHTTPNSFSHSLSFFQGRFIDSFLFPQFADWRTQSLWLSLPFVKLRRRLTLSTFSLSPSPYFPCHIPITSWRKFPSDFKIFLPYFTLSFCYIPLAVSYLLHCSSLFLTHQILRFTLIRAHQELC